MIQRHRIITGSSQPKYHRRLWPQRSFVNRTKKSKSALRTPFWRNHWWIRIGVCLLLLFNIYYLHPEWRVNHFHDVPPSSSQNILEDPSSTSNEIFTTLTTREKKTLAEMRQTFQQQRKEGKLRPCRIDDDCQSAGQNAKVLSWLRGSFVSNKVKLYNSLPFHRYVCGNIIWGNGGTLELEGSKIHKCLFDKTPYVYSPVPPPLSGIEIQPVELFWNYDSMSYYNNGQDDRISFETQPFQCTIPCRTAGEYSLLSIIAVKDTNWEIFSTMEGEKYYGQAHVKAKAYRQNQYYAVTSFQSDVPLPYFSWAEYNIQHPAVNFDTVIKGASFLAKNCDSDSKREDLVLELMKTSLRVDSLSGCHHNADPPKGVDINNKTAILEKYLFHLAFENQRVDDYITEKLWGALAAGTLPVYFGAPNIKDHVPLNSVIFVDDFASPHDLANYLLRLTKDKVLYQSYHLWRSKPIDPSFRDKYEFTNTHSTCRICKWAYAKRHGLAWNHTRQQIEMPRIDHKTCRNKVGLVGHPFKEYWLSASGEKAVSVESQISSKTCNLDASNRVIQVDGGAIQRKVYDQDGITDFVIDTFKTGRTYQLKLETPIATDKLVNFPKNHGQEWWLQDTRSRMTILTSQPVELTLVQQGTVQLSIETELRLRVIVEDVDTYHKGAKKYANYFGDLMKQDFFSPLEAYFILPK